MSTKSKGRQQKELIDYQIFLPAFLLIVAIRIPLSSYEDKALEILKRHLIN